MKAKFIISFFIILFFIHNSIEARIGETSQQCEERYGKPFTDEEDALTGYRKSGLLIFIEFFNNKAEMISFRKAEENILGMAEELSDNEIQTFLKANSGKKEWKKRSVISMDKEWETEDAEIFAQYITIRNTLIIATKGCLERKAAEKKAKEEEKLKDF